MKTYRRTIDGVSMRITPHPTGYQWGIQIDGEHRIKPQIVKCVNFKNESYWRLRPGSLPKGFNHQFHKSLKEALETIARLYNEWKSAE